MLANCWRPAIFGLIQISLGCFHCGVVTDLWSTPSFDFLKKSQGIKKKFLLEIMTRRKKSLLGLYHVSIDSKKHPIQDEDHSGSGPCSFHGFLPLKSGISPERVRTERGLVTSEKFLRVLIMGQKATFRPIEHLRQLFCYSDVNYLKTWVIYFSGEFYENIFLDFGYSCDDIFIIFLFSGC